MKHLTVLRRTPGVASVLRWKGWRIEHIADSLDGLKNPRPHSQMGGGGQMARLRDRRPREPACANAPPPKPAHRKKRAKEYRRKKTAWLRLSALELSGSHPGSPL